MSEFFGCIGRDCASAAHSMMARRGTDASSHGTILQNGIGGIVVCGDASTPIELYDIDHAVVVIVGHPYLVAAEGSRVRHRALAESLVTSYRRSGRSTVADLSGDFLVAIFDESRGTALLAVDRWRIQRVVYHHVANQFFFASDLDTIARTLDRPRLDRQSVLDYVYFHVVPAPRTMLEGVLRLSAGHFIEVDSAGSLICQPYWKTSFAPDHAATFSTLKSKFREALIESVAAASEEAACGCFLSGGTDSSTISGMLGQVGGRPAATFSIGFDVPGYDEMSYARIAARHFNTRHHEYYVTPEDVVDAVPKVVAAYDEPFGNASAIPTYYCARLAREHGIERLLAGDGGDELFGGNARYAKQHILGLYQRVPSALRRGLIEPLVLSSAATGRLPLLRKIRSYVEQASVPMPQRYESYNLVERLGWSTVFAPALLAATEQDHPHALMRLAFQPYAESALIDQMLAIDLRFVIADGDLPKVTRMCALAGVDVTFPMLDTPVADLAQRLPAHMKLRGTQLRWFFKAALSDFLPKETLTKRKQGFGLPVGTWLMSHPPLLELAHRGLDALKGRDIVHDEFLESLEGRLLREHPAYFGTMVWVLMMLGLWLERVSRRPAESPTA